jgi:YD repeat-containing protein
LLLATSLLALAAAASRASETTAYTYDELGRLTATSSSGTVNNGVATGVAYDRAGNRSSYTVTGAGAGGTPPPPPASSPPPPPPGANRPPAALDDRGEVPRCQTRDFEVTANDSDPDGDPLTLTAVTGDPGFSILSATTIRYSNDRPVGAFSATYTISDGRGGSATAVLHVDVPRDHC